MQNIWETIKNYYFILGKSYQVNPVIFLGIHIVATPLFLFAMAWMIKNYRKKRSIILPLVIAVLVFNSANIYLVVFGKNIPWWIYALLALTTIISGFFSYIKVRKKIKAT